MKEYTKEVRESRENSDREGKGSDLSYLIRTIIRANVFLRTISWHGAMNILLIIKKKFVCVFWPHRAARGILVPWPGIEPVSPAL